MYQSEVKNCQNCKTDFTIEPDDFSFYEKIKVPPPTFCPECRMHRRASWRNNMSLYNSKCDLCGKSVITIYSKESKLIIYCNKCWWSDKWDPKNYAMDYDFNKPFFTQYRDLIQKVPHMAIVNDNEIASTNCEYTYDCWFAKNCYMVFSAWQIENVYYSFFIDAGARDIMDCMSIFYKTEWMYDCITCEKSYYLKYSQLSVSCSNSSFLYDCRDCSDCFMCTGLRHKKYFFKNKEYSKDEYEKILKEYNLDTWSGVEKAKLEFDAFLMSFPRKYSNIVQSLNCTGENIRNGKNSKYSFNLNEPENCKYADFGSRPTDSLDISMSGELSECYEGVVVDHSQLNRFGLFSVKCQDIHYSEHCHSSKYIFGCSALRSSSYCILNKQYTKEEYEVLISKIIEQMSRIPYIDGRGILYKYGEYYPTELSYFGYNETIAMQQCPLTKEEVLKNKYHWNENIQITKGKETLKPKSIPDSIKDVSDDILNEVLICMDCDRNYKIVQNESVFYKKLEIPIPRRCFQCRHRRRLLKDNPMKLWKRQCMCEKVNHYHKSKCEVEFETSYAPDRPEIVYCEKCYQQEVY